MSVKERIITLRLIEKQKKNQLVFHQLGIMTQTELVKNNRELVTFKTENNGGI